MVIKRKALEVPLSRQAGQLPLATLGIAILLSCGGCSEREAASSPAAARTRVPVEVQRLARHPVRPAARASADILAQRQVVVATEAAGQVRKLLANVGDPVRRGQTLAQLDATKAGCNLSLIQARRDRAQAQLDKARRDLARARQLAQRGVAPPSQLDAAQSAVDLAEAALREAAAQLKLTASRMADSQVVAPFNGVVATRHVEVGDYLVPGRPVMTLVDYGTVKVKAGLGLAEALRIKRDAPCEVRVDLLGTRPIDGRVTAVGATADPTSRQVPVEVKIANPEGKLRPGMIAEVTFFLGEAVPTLLIPQSAVVEQFEISYAYVVERGRAARRQLKLGQPHGLEVAVKQGLRAGDRLVVVGQESLSPGAPVTVVKAHTARPRAP